jgi:transposase
MAPLTDGYRYHEVASTYGGVPQRWVVIYSEARQRRVMPTVDKYVRRQSETEPRAFKALCRTTFACAAEAQQALETCKQRVQATQLAGGTIRLVSQYGKRGRPATTTTAETVRYVVEGALASSLAYRQTVRDPKRGFILATNALDAQVLPTQEVLTGYKSQSLPERGFRFLQDPRFLASSLYLKKPERIMALLMVMTVCLLVYAALEYRTRQALVLQRDFVTSHPVARGHAYEGTHTPHGYASGYIAPAPAPPAG